MLKVTVMALAAAFYGKKGSALQTHFKDLFQKISPRRPSIPCTKPVEADFCMQPKEIHPSYSCKSWRSRRQVSVFPLAMHWTVLCLLCLPGWRGKHLWIFVDRCNCWLLVALVPVTFTPLPSLSYSIHVPFHKNKCRGSWFSAASGGCDSIREWGLGCSTKQGFPDAAGNQTLLCFE